MSDELPGSFSKLYKYVRQMERRIIKLRHMTLFHRPILRVVSFVLIFVLLIPLITAGILLINRTHTQYVLLTGPVGSTTAYIAPRIQSILEAPESIEQLLHINIVPNFELRPSCGGLDTNAQINAGVAHLGFAEDGFIGNSTSFSYCSSGSKQIQANTENTGETKKVRVLLNLYKSPLHVIVRSKLKLNDLQEIPSGTKAYLGGDGSSTYSVTQLIVEHFGLNIDRKGHALNFNQAAQALVDGEFDVAFFLAGLHNEVLKSLLQQGSEFQLLPIAKTESLRTLFPYLESLQIPPAVYTNVQSEVETIGTHTVLVASTALRDYEAYEITKKIAVHIQDLLWDVPLNSARIIDNDPSKDLFYPIHDGARRFFTHNPPFFLDIAMLTGIGAYFSVIYAFYVMLIEFVKGYRMYRFQTTIDLITEHAQILGDSTKSTLLDTHLQKFRRVALRLMRHKKITYEEFNYIEDYIKAYKL
ncbi:TRAP transporter TAXI family solute receptor [Nitrosomonas sp. Nm84]|uniref:TAXI family TRAP transporter solute-binding subunit n=1 Tax=Nitrosomonas sp. Nm84 TaxID=200124 RepID=UPI000D751748|nr:TAXI family TRAP transporter solute-binding subunit [Nitrosomonas sp. Nm84]PXW89961.1 TRAP transporter TAXI family solute receptor [Nitrosomonas sp. Nm84]